MANGRGQSGEGGNTYVKSDLLNLKRKGQDQLNGYPLNVTSSKTFSFKSCVLQAGFCLSRPLPDIEKEPTYNSKCLSRMKIY